MSDHFDTDDSRTDLTDLYAFPAPGRPDHSVLILNVNPEPSPSELSVDPAASYELKIDTDGDLEPELAFHVLFTPTSGAGATATLYRASGVRARGSGAIGDVLAKATMSIGETADVAESGDYRFFVGIRSDPHFKDILGFRNDFQFTGDDPIAKRNVIGIALEVPNAVLGPGGPVRIWVRTMAPVHGEIVAVDQAGRPGTNNAFNGPDENQLQFSATPPSEQLARFRDRFLAFLRSLGYSDAEAADLLPGYLPDVLAYDPSRPPGYPNGRRLTDDTADLLAGLLTKGRVTSDLAGPHTDLLEVFPYLGPPHPGESPETV